MRNSSSSRRRFFLPRPLALFLTGMMMLALSGCNSSDSTGILNVSLTDAPACGFDAVNVTVSKVRVHQSSSAMDNAVGWTEIVLNPARRINLLDLGNGALADLGQTPLEAGHYTQLRLVLAENNGMNLANSVIPTGSGIEVALDTPSAMQNGLKLIHGFDVVAGERADLMIDFDACKSVVMRGNNSYGLKPVMQMIPFTLNGITGYIDPALLGDKVTVSAQSSGAVVRATVPNPLTGEFFLARFEPGSYDVVVTADSHATAVISGVPVASATAVTPLSTAMTPLTLPASAMQSISGTITLAPVTTATVATATATQTVATTTVTVKSRSVDLLGAYFLSLPSAAPLFGPYGLGALPLALTADTAASGRYSLAAAAPGYQLQSFYQVILSGDALQDAILIP